MVLIMKFRETFLGLGLSSGTLFAHSIAGGTRITQFQFISVMILMFVIGFVLSSFNLEGPILASAIVISQLSGHFLLSDTKATSNEMLASHIIGGVLTYLVLIYADKLIAWFSHQVWRALKPIHIPDFKLLEGFALEVKGFCNCFKAITRNWSPAPPSFVVL